MRTEIGAYIYTKYIYMYASIYTEYIRYIYACSM